MIRSSMLAAAVGLALGAVAPFAAAQTGAAPSPASAPAASTMPAPAPAATAAATAATPAATPADPLARAVLGGKASMGLRVRYEGVDDDAIAKDATAVTLRTHVGWQSGPLGNFAATLEVDDVRALVDDYNATYGGDPTRPIVGDPEGTEVNVAALTYASGANSATLGRQRLAFDNQRFVGPVAWRQNEQTYDSVSVRTKALPRTELAYAYVANVNRVYGPRDGGTQAANWHGGSHLLHATVNAGAAGNVSLFAYLMEFDNAEAQSNATYGALWSGAVPFAGGWKLPFAVSYATQEDHGDNPIAYSADYYQVEAGVAYGPVTVKVGRESLGGDATRPGRMFRTPLATLHAFQGWADKFLTTPAQGLEDTYVGVLGRVGGFDLQASWHDFGAEAVSRDYGTEIDLAASRKFAGRYEVLLKFADYRADGFAADTRKYWVQVAASF